MEAAVVDETNAKARKTARTDAPSLKGPSNPRGDASSAADHFRKIEILAARGAEAMIKRDAENLAAHSRVRGLLQLVLSGALTTLLRNSTLINEEDRLFLRRHGYLPAKGPKEAA